MSVFKTAKKKAGRLVDKLLPGSRDTSPIPPPAEPTQPAPSSDRHAYADPQAPPTAAATAGSAIYELLAAVRDGSDLFLPLKAALTGVVKIWDICERTAKVKDEYEKLESRLAQLTAVTKAYGKRDPDPNLKLRLNNIAYSFGQLVSCIEAKRERGLPRRVLESNADVNEAKDIIAKISALVEAFLYESTIRVEIAVHDILSRLPTAEEMKMKKDLERWSQTTQTIKNILGPRRVDEAPHTAQPKDAGCLAGTRRGVLDKFLAWVKEDAKSIFWLAGMAGTGKTSVALTLCRELESDPEVILGGSFFCSRTENVEARTNVRRILPTLAVLLSRQSPKFAVELAAEIRPNSSVVGYEPVSDQIKRLLQRPLSALASETRRIVFVIDALDECAKERELDELLRAIATFQWAANVKFILTSRPETHILDTPISDRAQNEILQLHMMETAEVTKDIQLYIDDAFKKKALASAKQWYTDADVTALAALSNGLFIFASTVITYVTEVKSVAGRTTRLQKALAAVGQSGAATASLDTMYEFVLTRASDTAKVDADELEATRCLLACILAARAPLSVTALAELLSLEVDDLHNSLRHLRATVHVPSDDDEPGLRTLHASFGDYLLERAPTNLRISLELGEDTLARGCLQLMSKQLHFDVSRSRSSYEPNASAKPDNITLSLEYACLNWIYHVAALPEPTALVQEVELAIRLNFLFWLEVMSVLGQVRRATAMLIIAVSTFQSTDLSQFLRDANTFVASSREAIARSAPHIYLSALPFEAKDSLIYKTFIPLCTGLVSVETYGIDRHGGRLVMTFIGHRDSVNSVAYSPDGRLVASGGSDGTVRIWDTHIGEEAVSPLRSGHGWVPSVAFAPNGNSLASATGSGVVCVWSNLTGVPNMRQLRGHSRLVNAVVFSPSGSLLASASEDKTARIWKVQTGDEVTVLSSHSDEVGALAFSSDGQILASGSYDQTIRLWRASTWEPAREPLRDPNGAILSLSFSLDGTKLASSGSTDGNITIWEPRSGIKIATLLGLPGWWVPSVHFSPNGQSLVSAGAKGTVCIWTFGQDLDEASSTALSGHTQAINSTVFSPDGLYVISSSTDGTVRMWDASSGQATVQPLKAHNVPVNAVAVLPDSSFIVSGCDDESVGAWDVRTGEPKLGPLVGHPSNASSLAISSDGHWIATASREVIRLWNTHTSDLIRELLRPKNEFVLAIAFAPDTSLLAAGTDDHTVLIWDPATGQPSSIGPLGCEAQVKSVAFSPDGRLIGAGGRDGFFNLWYATSGQPARQPFFTGADIFCFSPSSAYIVSGDANGVARIWDLATGQHTLTLDGHANWINTISYSRDGRFIATGSDDNTACLWDAATGAAIATLHGHQHWVLSVAFTPDGQSIVSSSRDCTIRVWDVERAQALSSASEDDAVAALASAKLDGGWLVGPSGRLVLWIPEPYRNYVQISPCTVVIGRHRIVIAPAENDLYAGEKWNTCWRQGVSSHAPRAR